MGRREKEIDLAQVESLAGRGLNEAQVADALGICPDTLTRRKRKYSAFSDALKRGQAKGVAKIANALFEQGMKGQTAAAIFFMKNRAGWSDKQDYRVDGNIDHKHTVEQLPETDSWLESIIGSGEETEDPAPRTH